MSKMIPLPSPEINRLRAAAALIPIIESGLADAKITAERAALMASFCEWSTETTSADPEAVRLVAAVGDGLKRLKIVLGSAG